MQISAISLTSRTSAVLILNYASGRGIVFIRSIVISYERAGICVFMGALTLVTMISFVDDIRSTSQKLRLLFHFSAMALMFSNGAVAMPWWWVWWL